MENKQTHTPLPWRLDRRHSDPETRASYIEILPMEGGCWGEWSPQEICGLFGATDGSIQAANAALIVEAVNNHARLLAESAQKDARIAELERALAGVTQWAETMEAAHAHPFLNNRAVVDARSLLTRHQASA